MNFYDFFTGEERRNFAVFIQKFFQYGYGFDTKVINFRFFFNCHHHAINLIKVIMQI